MYLTYLGWLTNSEVLNRETADRYDLRVVAYDLGDVSRSSTADVEVRTSSGRCVFNIHDLCLMVHNCKYSAISLTKCDYRF